MCANRTVLKREENSTCIFSADNCYRYTLEHRWDGDLPCPGHTVVWCMLNPSTADTDQLDPTLRRCKGFSQSWGAGGMVIINLFAFRATDPKHMMAMGDEAVGPDNDYHITTIVRRPDIDCVVAGWGKHGRFRDREKAVMNMLNGRLTALKFNKDGTACHPLYLPYTCQRHPYGYYQSVLP